jgi:hypothetical protein
MAYQVSDKAKKQSTECSHNFTCLNNDIWNTCSVKRDLQGAFLVINTNKNKSTCPYCFSYGDLLYCTCPTRREIYHRYNI